MQEEFDFFAESQQQNEFNIDEANFINKAALLIESKYKNLKNDFSYLVIKRFFFWSKGSFLGSKTQISRARKRISKIYKTRQFR